MGFLFAPCSDHPLRAAELTRGSNPGVLEGNFLCSLMGFCSVLLCSVGIVVHLFVYESDEMGYCVFFSFLFSICLLWNLELGES